jgi:4-amino-4-deoxy-L-arabinose transferase-like glycosyltransferase
MSAKNAGPSHRIIWALLALIAATLAVYSQTRAFAWDEGFHLVTAANINRGKLPYIDFCFPQTPLNAYWNAGWMRIFGESWRTPHGVAAVMTSLAVLLIAAYTLRRFPAPNWRAWAAIAAVCLFGMNLMVVEFGTIAQAYALSLFLIVSAFLFTISAVDRSGLGFASAAGFLASAAANCTLLTAPVAPVLLLWMLFCNRAGSRWTKSAAFIAGGIAPCLPLAWLLLRGPHQTVFNILHYNLLYRQRQWDGAIAHNFGEWFAWVDSPQSWTLGLLAIVGLLFIRKRSGWDLPHRREFYLCAWLAVALIIHISTATPTFRRYYLLAVPFVTILACAGLYDIGSRLASVDRPLWPVLIVCLLTASCLVKRIIDSRDDFGWGAVDKIAAKVNQLTPPGAMLFADEPTYFVAHRVPPDGQELADSHKLDFPPAEAHLLHVMSEAEVDRQIKAGVFDVVEMSDDDARVDSLGLHKLYAHNAQVEDYDIFYGKQVPAKPAPAR